MQAKSITDVAEYQQCCGCGLCSFYSPEKYKIIDDYRFGKRPIDINKDIKEPQDLLKLCPGNSLEMPEFQSDKKFEKELADAWGPVMEVWEGHAVNESIRYKGSSGGAATALAALCMDKLDYSGTLHIAAKKDKTYLNETIYSKNIDSLIENTGSRYSPASPCDRLDLVEKEEGKSVFIGKPCDVSGVRNLVESGHQIKDKIGLTISIFCAGTPSTNGTFEMLNAMGVKNKNEISSLRYRGNGWPGKATAETEKGMHQMTYAESWGNILQKHRQWRCYICPDHSGEFADISVGDPWYKDIPENAKGSSLILIRSDRGREIFNKAIKEGYIVAKRVPNNMVDESQKGLLKVRGSLWARLLILKSMGVSHPNYKGFSMFKFWWALSFKEKLQSTIGTIRRISKKQLRKRILVQKDS